MLRREYTALHSAEDEDERVKAPIGADYGPANASWMKLVGERELRVWPNGMIAHEWWEWQVKTRESLSPLLLSNCLEGVD